MRYPLLAKPMRLRAGEPMIRVNHAVLHAFDFESGSAYLSEEELPLDDRQVRSYVQRHLRRISSSAESRHGEFAEGSQFAEQLVETFDCTFKQAETFIYSTLSAIVDYVVWNDGEKTQLLLDNLYERISYVLRERKEN
jgi:hypothetical protein